MDPFDISDGSDVEAMVQSAAKKGKEQKPAEVEKKKAAAPAPAKKGKKAAVDPFDVSDDSDMEAAVWGKPKKPEKGKKGKKVEVDPFDVSDDSELEAEVWGKTKKPESKLKPKPEPKAKAKAKPSKPAKRKFVDEPPSEDEPARKKPSKAVLDKMAQDDAEIAALEKKLKIKSGKVPKSMQDDGLDFLLEGLKDSYLDDEKKKAKKEKLDAKKTKKARAMIEDSEDEEHSEDNEDDGMDYLLDGDSGEEDENEKGTDSDDDGEETEFGGFSEAEEEDAEPAAPIRVRENPYKPGVTITETDEVKPAGKYIPPSMRKPASTESERMTRLRRQVQGLINRLSEVKLVAILGDFEELYRMNPRADVTGIITEILVATLCDPSILNDTYHILHGGFLAGLYKILGTDVGATVVQRIVEEFLVQHERVNGVAGPSTAGKECTNIMSFLSELYNFQVIGCVLIFDFIRMFLSELTELHTELLLKVVRSKLYLITFMQA